ncbi:MAG: hypothetical protein IJO77_00140 [Oscillospiraceae bacterium]|nr:hypothetical protein [Oscillospiraceae bacterium]
MGMKYICLYHDYLDKFDQLDDEEAGRLTKALLRYAVYGEIADLGRVEMAYFSFIRSNIDREREQYAYSAIPEHPKPHPLCTETAQIAHRRRGHCASKKHAQTDSR